MVEVQCTGIWQCCILAKVTVSGPALSNFPQTFCVQICSVTADNFLSRRQFFGELWPLFRMEKRNFGNFKIWKKTDHCTTIFYHNFIFNLVCTLHCIIDYYFSIILSKKEATHSYFKDGSRFSLHFCLIFSLFVSEVCLNSLLT